MSFDELRPAGGPPAEQRVDIQGVGALRRPAGAERLHVMKRRACVARLAMTGQPRGQGIRRRFVNLAWDAQYSRDDLGHVTKTSAFRRQQVCLTAVFFRFSENLRRERPHILGIDPADGTSRGRRAFDPQALRHGLDGSQNILHEPVRSKVCPVEPTAFNSTFHLQVPSQVRNPGVGRSMRADMDDVPNARLCCGGNCSFALGDHRGGVSGQEEQRVAAQH